MKLLQWSLQLLVSLLFLIFSKICHGHLHLFIPLLKKAVIKRQEDKLPERKWRKCWKIAEMKEFKETPKGPNLYKLRGRKISVKLTREDEETYVENVRTLTQIKTEAFLMMGQITNQGVLRNYYYQPSHYQLSNFGSPIICKSNSLKNPNLGESSNISERHSQSNRNIAQMEEERTHY